MSPRVLKVVLVVLSVLLACLAVASERSHYSRKLAFMGGSLIVLAGAARRHFAEDIEL